MDSEHKIHKSNKERKSELRCRLVNFLGGSENCRVLETHSGPGIMRSLSYQGIHDWLGIDEDTGSPKAIHHDSREVLRAIDVSRFNLFDIDAFGSPWEHLWVLSERLKRVRRPERIGLAITSGTQGGLAAMSPNLARSGWSKQMADAVGVSSSTAGKWFTGIHGANPLANRLVKRWFSGWDVGLWISGRSKGKAWYWGIGLQGGVCD